MVRAYPQVSDRVQNVIQANPNIIHVHDTPAATTGSTTRIMGGLAIAFTPKFTGRVRFYLIAYVSNSVASDGVLIQPAYGTGTAPAPGAAATGTTISAAKTATSPIAGSFVDLSFITFITGLTINTQYWFDIQGAVVTGGTATLQDFEVVIEEY